MLMTPAELAAVRSLASDSGHTHELYSYQPYRWFESCYVSAKSAR